MPTRTAPRRPKHTSRRLAPVFVLLALTAAACVQPATPPPPPPAPTIPTTAPHGPLADMTVVSISMTPVDPRENDHVVFSAVVRNNGNAPTPQGIAIGVSFGIDQPNDHNVVTWSDNHRDALAPGATTTLTANSGPLGVNWWNAVKGGHTVWAWVDNINRFPELNEGNNQIPWRSAPPFAKPTLSSHPSAWPRHWRPGSVGRILVSKWAKKSPPPPS